MNTGTMMGGFDLDADLNELREHAEQAAADTGLPAPVLRPALSGKVGVELFKPRNTPTENRLLDAEQAIDLLDRSAGQTNVFAHPNLPRAVLRKLALIEVTLTGKAGTA